MKTKEHLDWILYGNGKYVSALPALVVLVAYDVLCNLIERLVEKINHRK